MSYSGTLLEYWHSVRQDNPARAGFARVRMFLGYSDLGRCGPGHNGNRAARRAFDLLLKKLSPRDQRILDDYISTIMRSALKINTSNPKKK